MTHPLVDLETLFREANALEPLPRSATRLISILSEEDWDPDDVVEVVSLDAGLTGRVLGMANSAAFGAAVEIGSVDAAILRLGSGTVLSVAIGSAVRWGRRCHPPEYGFDAQELWSGSVASALAVDGMRALTGLSIPAEAATAALLRDVGRLLIARHLDSEVLWLLRSARGGGAMAELGAEAELVGVHHGQLGGLMARCWGLPEPIAEAICHHHEPWRVEGEPARQALVQCVHLADAVASRITETREEDSAPLDPELQRSMEALGIEPAGFEGLCESVEGWIEELGAWFA